MSQAIITTWPSRTEVHLSAPTPAMLDIRDIAHSLALTNRFIGHTRTPYNVAAHCVIGSYYVRPEFALEFLLHDGHEAYLGDVTGPLKSLLMELYLPLANRFDRVIAEKFGLRDGTEIAAEIERVDRLMLECEIYVLKTDPPRVLPVGTGATSMIAHIRNPPRDSEQAYLDRFHALMSERYQRQLDQEHARAFPAERRD